MKSSKWLFIIPLALLAFTGFWGYKAATDETYEGMSIIPEQHQDIPMLEGLNPRRHDYVIDGNQWRKIYDFYMKELPERGWKAEYNQAEKSWEGFMSRWSKEGFDGNLFIGAFYNKFDDQTEVIFDRHDVLETTTWIEDSVDRICIYGHPNEEGCLVIEDKERITRIVRMINNEAYDTDHGATQEIYGSGVKQMKPDPDFFELTNLTHLKSY